MRAVRRGGRISADVKEEGRRYRRRTGRAPASRPPRPENARRHSRARSARIHGTPTPCIRRPGSGIRQDRTAAPEDRQRTTRPARHPHEPPERSRPARMPKEASRGRGTPRASAPASVAMRDRRCRMTSSLLSSGAGADSCRRTQNIGEFVGNADKFNLTPKFFLDPCQFGYLSWLICLRDQPNGPAHDRTLADHFQALHPVRRGG